MLAPLTPALRAQMRDLRLASRRGGAAGLGQHASRVRGAGLEFAEYRAYEPGDDPRRIDWKLYARSDRHFVREAERDSALGVWLVIDTSASMGQRDAGPAAPSRLEAARQLAACVIELALRQGDRFGLLAVGGAAPLFLPAHAGRRQRDQVLLALERLNAAATLPDPARLLPMLERMLPPALVLLLSDFFDESMVELALRLAATRREVLSIQLLTAGERDFPYAGGHRFVDPESGSELRVEAAAARRDYLERFAAARARLAQRFTAAGIRHAEYVLDRPLIEPLRVLFGGDRGSGP